MKAIILAAGYGTRLQKGLNELKEKDSKKHEKIKGFIEGKAKPLVIIAGKPMIEYAIENIERAGVGQVFIVTNNKYYDDFEKWKKNYKANIKIKIINDGTKSNDERLGTVGDFKLVLEQEKVGDDALVLSGDNLFTFEMKDFVDFYNEKHRSVAAVYREKDKNRLRKSGNAVLDENKRIVSFEEKPENPPSEWICPALYIYDSKTLKLIKETDFYGDNKDLIGNIIVLFHNKIPFYAFTGEGKLRFDIGSIDDFERADEYMRKKQK